MNLADLRPGMEGVALSVKILKLKERREVTTNYGLVHSLVEGEVEDDSGMMDLTVWNEMIEQVNDLSAGDEVELTGCFVTSFKGVLSLNVGRDSGVKKK